ncbi:hypothetical protein ACFO3D_00895 [Virgibacillus kekensis]|uniref:XRE family transcriptional regulator n=1 Tax=Virgibacillus kekensis TaxID=202261 RepID=A0ABV9DEK3_9BACI
MIELERYINDHLEERTFSMMEPQEQINYSIQEDSIHGELEDFIKKNRKPTLNQVLFRYVDEKGLKDSEVYKRAGIDRRHFSKIRSNPDYQAGKNTVIALAFSLELSYEETGELLDSAGYSLSDSDTYDLVIQFCLEKNIYDLHDVNQALDYFSLKPLTGLY